MKNYLVHFLAVFPKQKRSMKTVKAKTDAGGRGQGPQGRGQGSAIAVL